MLKNVSNDAEKGFLQNGQCQSPIELESGRLRSRKIDPCRAFVVMNKMFCENLRSIRVAGLRFKKIILSVFAV